MRASLQQVERATGRRPPELDTPPPPAALAHLLPIFFEAASGRSWGFGSPQPLSWADLEAFGRLTGTELSSLEWRLVKTLDAEWMSAYREAEAAKAKAKR